MSHPARVRNPRRATAAPTPPPAAPPEPEVPETTAPPEPAPEPIPEPAPAPPSSDAIIAEVELPSKGKFYGDKCPDGLVKIRPMTGRDEALVAGMDVGDLVDVFDTLLSRCLKTEGLTVDDMLATDKFYLMLCLRANSYGGDYEFRVRCPSCQTPQNHTCVVPDDFEIMWYEDEEVEPFDLELPMSGNRIQYRLLRGADEKDIVKYHDREILRKGQRFGNPSYVYRMAKHIVSINGEPVESPKQAMDFFEELIAGDSSAIGNAVEDKVSGVKTEMDISCIKCKFVFQADMPFTAGFFRTQRR